METILIAEAPIECATSRMSAVHYRLLLRRDNRPTTVCMQDFDYVEYDADRFLTATEHASEAAARTELNELLHGIASDPDFEVDAKAVRRMVAAGAPLTRRQALVAALSQRSCSCE